MLDLGQKVKKAVEREKMLAWQFNTIGVSDGITMGGEGKLLLVRIDAMKSTLTYH